MTSTTSTSSILIDIPVVTSVGVLTWGPTNPIDIPVVETAEVAANSASGRSPVSVVASSTTAPANTAAMVSSSTVAAARTCWSVTRRRRDWT